MDGSIINKFKELYKNVPGLCEKLIGMFLLIFVVFSPVSIAGTNIAWVLALVFWLLKSLSEKRIQFEKTPLNVPLLCFFAAIVISVIASVDIKYGIKGLRSSILFIIYFLFVNNVRDKNQMRKLLNVLVIFTVISAAYGIFQHFTGIDFLRDNIFLKKVLPRSTGFYGIPMTFAEHLSLVLMLVAGMLLTKDRGMDIKKYARKNIWWILSFVIIAMGLYFSVTRGAWVGSLAGLLFLLLLRSKKVFLIGLVTSVVLISIVFVLFPKTTASKRFLEIHNKKDNSIVRRLHIWKRSLNMFKDYPVTGVGWECYRKMYPKYYIKHVKHRGPKWRIFIKKTFSHAHNNFLNIAAETGIIGLGAFFWLIITVIRESFKIHRITKDKYLKSVCAGGMTAFVVFIISGFTEYTFGDSEVLMLMYFILGIVFVIPKIDHSD